MMFIINTNVKNIPLAFDYKFKKVFGDSEAIERLEQLISLFFELPINDVKGNIHILNNEKLKKYNNEKGGVSDVYLRLDLITGSERINIEVRSKKLSQVIMDRNFSYNAYHISTQLHRNYDYSKFERTITICLDKGLKDKVYNEKVIIDKYELIDINDNHKFTDKLQIYHIDIEKCYNIWHNNNVKNYEKHDQIMIYLGALLCTENIIEFGNCLKEIPMDEKVKKDIETTNYDLNCNDDLMSWYSREQDEIAIKNGERAEMLADVRAEVLDEGIKQGIEKGIEQRNFELARKFKEKGVDIQLISEVTGLNVSSIESL